MILELLKLEMRLMMRTTRPLFLIISGLFIYIISLRIVNEPTFVGNKIKLCYIILMNMGAFSYSNFLVAWEGMYFDLLMTLNIQMKEYIQAKYILNSCFILLNILIALPLFIVNSSLVVYFVTAFLYHIGISIPVMIFAGKYNTEKINLVNGSLILEGINGNQFLSVIVCIVPPIILYFTLSYFLQHTNILIVMNVIFVIFICCKKQIINRLTKVFNQNKYTLLNHYSK